MPVASKAYHFGLVTSFRSGEVLLRTCFNLDVVHCLAILIPVFVLNFGRHDFLHPQMLTIVVRPALVLGARTAESFVSNTRQALKML